MAEFAVLVVDKIDSFLGETIVMLDAQHRDKGWIVLRNYIQPEQVQPLLKDTCLSGYEIVEEDATKMRLALVDMAKAAAKEPGDGTCGSCPVDSHFNVKGVGTVVLGSVAHGYFRVHDKMQVFPLGKEVVLRSIQKHDVNADYGIAGDHVGLALKGIESEELDRGFVLTTDPSVKMSSKFTGTVRYNGFWKNPLKDGMMIHVGHWMQMVPARVSVQGSDTVLDFDSGMIHRPGDEAVLMYLEGGKLRVIGSVVLP